MGGSDDNYSFTYVNGVLTVTQAAATLTMTGASQQYTGEPIPVTVTTNPSGLESGVVVTYDGSSAVPSALGTYAVEANLVDQNYTGTVSGNLTISKGTNQLHSLTVVMCFMEWRQLIWVQSLLLVQMFYYLFQVLLMSQVMAK